MNERIRGTIADFAGKLTVNGVTLGQPELSMLTRIGRGSFFKAIGTVPKPAGVRGKPATIWELNLEAALSFAFMSEPQQDEEENADDGPDLSGWESVDTSTDDAGMDTEL